MTDVQRTRQAETKDRQRLSDPYQRVADQILLYSGNNSTAGDLATIGDAVILHGRAGFRIAKEMPAECRVLIDAEYYKTDRDDKSEGQLLPLASEESIRQQVAAGVACLLAPSRFPDDRSPDSLKRVLDAARDFIACAEQLAPTLPAFAPVVVKYDELADRRWVKLLSDAGIPVALVFAAFMDPLSDVDRLRGAIDLVQATDKVMILRCDLSAVGLMAAGASVGAMGASSSVRHLWLPSKRPKRRKEPVLALFLPAGAAWVNEVFLRQAQAHPELDDLFGCSCVVCGPGGDLRNLFETGATRDLLDRHSISAAVRLGRSVVASEAPLNRWKHVCENASETFARFDALKVAGPGEPQMLQAWRKALD